jgi:hypothetical protein
MTFGLSMLDHPSPSPGKRVKFGFDFSPLFLLDDREAIAGERVRAFRVGFDLQTSLSCSVVQTRSYCHVNPAAPLLVPLACWRGATCPFFYDAALTKTPPRTALRREYAISPEKCPRRDEQPSVTHWRRGV